MTEHSTPTGHLEAESGQDEIPPKDAATGTPEDAQGGAVDSLGREQNLDEDEAAGGRSDHSTVTLPDWDWVWDRINERRIVCRERARIHGRRASRWQRAATPLAWITAVLAALSGLSVVSDSQDLAVWFSVATALVAATNLALQPTETAKSDRAAATAYDRLARRLDDFWTFDGGEVGTPAGEGDVRIARKRIQEFDLALEAIEESHPPPTIPDSAPWYRSRQPPSLVFDRETYVAGDPITGTFDHRQNKAQALDWVGIYKVGEDPDQLRARFWQYGSSGQESDHAVRKGSLTFSADAAWEGDTRPWWPPEEGDYAAYLFEAGTNRRLAEALFSVVPASNESASIGERRAGPENEPS